MSNTAINITDILKNIFSTNTAPVVNVTPAVVNTTPLVTNTVPVANSVVIAPNTDPTAVVYTAANNGIVIEVVPDPRPSTITVITNNTEDFFGKLKDLLIDNKEVVIGGVTITPNTEFNTHVRDFWDKNDGR